MLDLGDERWRTLRGGYGEPVDLRPLLVALETSADREASWDGLWNALHHQGTVGEGSFVAVPHLVRIHRTRGVPDWNTYALAATIELARGVRGNPDVPDWSRGAYDGALGDLAELGLQELPRAADTETVRSIIGLLAIVYGARTYGRVIVSLTEDEVEELEQAAWGAASGGPD